MATLEEILNRVTENQKQANEQKEYDYTVHGISYKVLTMTSKEKKDFIYSRSATKQEYKVSEIVKSMIPFIYKSFQLSEFAQKLVTDKKIKTYYDIVEALFTPEEIIEIMGFIMEINNIGGSEDTVKEDYEEIKKQ